MIRNKYILSSLIFAVVAFGIKKFHSENNQRNTVICQSPLIKSFHGNDRDYSLDGMVTLIVSPAGSLTLKVNGYAYNNGKPSVIDRDYKIITRKNNGFLYNFKTIKMDKSDRDETDDELMRRIFFLASKSDTVYGIRKLNEQVYLVGNGYIPIHACVVSTKLE